MTPETWTDRENLEEDKNTSFNLDPDSETYNTYDEPMVEDTAELVIESSALESRENIFLDLEDCASAASVRTCMACKRFLKVQ